MKKKNKKAKEKFCEGCNNLRQVFGENCWYCNADGKLKWRHFPENSTPADIRIWTINGTL